MGIVPGTNAAKSADVAYSMPVAVSSTNGVPAPMMQKISGTILPRAKMPACQIAGASRTVGAIMRNSAIAEGGSECVTAWRVNTIHAPQIATVMRSAA